MEQWFFEPGRLYRRRADGGEGGWELFLVAHVAVPPGGFAARGAGGPVAFGWLRTGGPDGRPLGPFTAHTPAGWSDVTDSGLEQVLGLTGTRTGGWRSATAAGPETAGTPGGRRVTDPAPDTTARTGRRQARRWWTRRHRRPRP
ncbi:hypothetical protein GCM10010441_75660 [Kitasatospora paracochleata]|uniref:Uncharacterized protein n=1 Tax=Kitasatospora paracochleata TaxID=58354 RepID=A0ABT1JAX9_9ACTN|nr:hypothetical protein [Kitasatospora paracochleata]MCP2314279.1 hypothetical protein [Kitasatospora paracochleata]